MNVLKGTLLFVFVFGITFFSCKKEEEPPCNPYDSVDYGKSDSTEADTLGKNEITSIHQDIFHPKCATPGCHDGTFEPDFSTVMSTYSSTVYHPVVKNNAEKSFTYRVLPGKSEKSVLYERISNCCFVNANDRMPQDNIGESLPAEDVARIKAWIDNGAKDIEGETPLEPNSEPVFQFVYAIVDLGFPVVYNTKELSKDSNRVGGVFYGAMLLDTNMNVVLTTKIADDKTAVADLKSGRLLLSYDKDDFSSPIQTAVSSFIDAEGGIWYNTFSTKGITENKTVFMRYYINDGDHLVDTEFPSVTSPEHFKGHWSFVVQPGSN